jgi:hypothetical protein
MRFYTFTNNQQLIKGIPTRARKLDADRSLWEVSVGSFNALGVLDACHFTKGSNTLVDLSEDQLPIIVETLPRDPYYVVKLCNQSPKDGAWAMTKTDGVDLLASGYHPTVRKGTQGEGAEYLVHMVPGSLIKLAIAGRPASGHKFWMLKAEEEGLILQHCDHNPMFPKPVEQVPLALESNGKPWPK